MVKRVALIVLDSLGVGALDDAAKYGDEGANTLGHIIDNVPDIKIPNMRDLGLCNISGVKDRGLGVSNPKGCYARLKEVSAGKDTITGHWEIAGLCTDIPFLTFPDGFPPDFIKAFEEAIGRKTLGNFAASGTQIIMDLGEEHERTGKPIVYTSADSVFQIAANTSVIPLEQLYGICEKARQMLTGDIQVGRVIARPFVVRDGKYERTSDRKDYAVSPFGTTILDILTESGCPVHGVGKISDIFNGRGITDSHHNEDNMDGIKETVRLLKSGTDGFIFTNLVDFDSKFGHRRDVKGYAGALEEFDFMLPEIIGAMGDEDMMILCADHGNDPVHTGTDHTREAVPMVAYAKNIRGGTDLGERESFADIGAFVCDFYGVKKPDFGSSFLKEVIL